MASLLALPYLALTRRRLAHPLTHARTHTRAHTHIRTRARTRARTHARTCTCAYTHIAGLPLTSCLYRPQTLEFEVWDWDLGKKHDFLGWGLLLRGLALLACCLRVDNLLLACCLRVACVLITCCLLLLACCLRVAYCCLRVACM